MSLITAPESQTHIAGSLEAVILPNSVSCSFSKEVFPAGKADLESLLEDKSSPGYFSVALL